MTPTLTLTPEQARCNDAVGEWLRTREKPWFTIHGYAGSGKTSLARHFASQQDGTVVYAAYTGKAASVLQKKGCTPAMTIHRMLYLPQSERNAELDELRTKLEAPDLDPALERRYYKRIEELQSPKWCISPKSPLTGASLLVLDECSMVDERLAEDILAFNVPVLVLGDPGQLPPIDGAGYFDARCDFMLSEVHRQAKESPVIRLAMAAREGQMLKRGDYGTSRVINKREIGKEEALGVSQIICGLNRTRVALNKENRALRGFSGAFPNANERLICLRNNQKTGMLNGLMVDLKTDAVPVMRELVTSIDDPAEPTFEDTPFVEFETLEHGKLRAYKQCFTKPEAIKAMDYRKRSAADEFDWAWAISCHKSQGSQFESVLVYDEFTWDRDLHKRWLYTATTRAEDRVIIAL